MATRSEHLQWCKDRANEYIDRGDLHNAFMSFASDIRKHEETAHHEQTVAMVGMPMLMGGHLSTAEEMREYINGFN